MRTFDVRIMKEKMLTVILPDNWKEDIDLEDNETIEDAVAEVALEPLAFDHSYTSDIDDDNKVIEITERK